MKKLHFRLGFFFDGLGVLFLIGYFLVDWGGWFWLMMGGASWVLGILFYYLWRQDIRTLEQYQTLQSLQKIHPLDFEYFVSDILKKKGYQAQVVGGQNDRGIDVRATKNGKMYVVQCKRYRANLRVKSKEMQQFIGSMAIAKADGGIFVTTSSFTDEARSIAKEQGIELWDEKALRQMI